MASVALQSSAQSRTCLASPAQINIYDLGCLYIEDLRVRPPCSEVASSLILSDASVGPTANITRLTSGEATDADALYTGSQRARSSSATWDPPEGKSDHKFCRDGGGLCFFGLTQDTLDSFFATELEETLWSGWAENCEMLEGFEPLDEGSPRQITVLVLLVLLTEDMLQRTL